MQALLSFRALEEAYGGDVNLSRCPVTRFSSLSFNYREASTHFILGSNTRKKVVPSGNCPLQAVRVISRNQVTR